MVRTGSSASFAIAFEGPGVEDGTIDVRDLAPALLALGTMVDAANRAIHGNQAPAHIKARAVSAGCFEVSLEVVIPAWEMVKGLLLSDDSRAAATLLAYLGLVGGAGASVIALYRKLKGRRPDRVQRSGSEVTVIIGADELVVPLDVLRLYQEVAVHRAMTNLLAPLDSGRIERIEFRRSAGAPAEQTITAADKPSFVLPEPEDETVVDDTHRMALSIRSLAFQEGNKWRLFDGQNVITASIEDKDFLSRVDSNEIRFAKSDILICSVQVIQKQTADGLKTEHIVKRVLEYKSAPTQIALFDDEPPSAPDPLEPSD
jgi:hypothetical protein